MVIQSHKTCEGKIEGPGRTVRGVICDTMTDQNAQQPVKSAESLGSRRGLEAMRQYKKRSTPQKGKDVEEDKTESKFDILRLLLGKFEDFDSGGVKGKNQSELQRAPNATTGRQNQAPELKLKKTRERGTKALIKSKSVSCEATPEVNSSIRSSSASTLFPKTAFVSPRRASGIITEDRPRVQHVTVHPEKCNSKLRRAWCKSPSGRMAGRESSSGGLNTTKSSRESTGELVQDKSSPEDDSLKPQTTESESAQAQVFQEVAFGLDCCSDNGDQKASRSQEKFEVLTTQTTYYLGDNPHREIETCRRTGSNLNSAKVATVTRSPNTGGRETCTEPLVVAGMAIHQRHSEAKVIFTKVEPQVLTR